MSVCELVDSPDVEMYFYDELDAGRSRRASERHLRGCDACRQRLDDLHAIRHALAERPVDRRAASRRLVRLHASARLRRRRTVEPSNLRTAGTRTPNLGTLEPWNLRTAVALAAVLALVTIGVLARGAVPSHAAADCRRQPYAAGAVRRTAPADEDGRAGRSRLREGSVEHLERSKLVVLGLATRDPHARARRLAVRAARSRGRCCPTRGCTGRQPCRTRRGRRGARDARPRNGAARGVDERQRQIAAALERVQRLIAKRDLVVKMQVMAAAGPAGN